MRSAAALASLADALPQLLAGLALLAAFALLLPFRLPLSRHRLADAAMLQGIAAAASVAWQSWCRGAPGLAVLAAIAVGTTGVALPLALRRLSRDHAEQAVAADGLAALPSAILGVSAVVLALALVPPDAALPMRSDLAVALGMVLLGLLTMAARQGAAGRLGGFLSMLNGTVLAMVPADAASVPTMPLCAALLALAALGAAGLWLAPPAMNPALLVLAAPAAGIVLLAAVPSWRAAIWINAAACAATFAAALLLPWLAPDPPPDALSICLAMPTMLIGVCAGWSGIVHDRAPAARESEDARRPRFRHMLFQAFLGSTLLALLADDPTVTWTAIAAAAVTAMLATAAPRTASRSNATAPAASAAWRFFLFGGVGLVLALFGTLLLYRAVPPSAGAPLRWSTLPQAASRCDGATLNLAFALMLTGYGSLAALAPLHFWLEDMMVQAPAPFALMLAPSFASMALGILLRLRDAMAANHAAGGGAVAPGLPLMALGLVSVLFTGSALWRRRDMVRLLALAAIGHAGVVLFAFGVGSPVSRFAGLLHLTQYTLTMTAILIAADLAARLHRGRRLADPRGLMQAGGPVGATLAFGLAALAGLPPLGPFTSLFLIGIETVLRVPWLALPFGVGILASGWALLSPLRRLFGAAPPGPAPRGEGLAGEATALLPAWLLLAVAIALGLAMPPQAAAWLRQAAQ